LSRGLTHISVLNQPPTLKKGDAKKEQAS